MLFVVTNPQNGWDCVSGTIYEADNEQQVLQHISDEKGITVEELENNSDTIVHETFHIVKLN